jgi:hypothetical protein
VILYCILLSITQQPSLVGHLLVIHPAAGTLLLLLLPLHLGLPTDLVVFTLAVDPLGLLDLVVGLLLDVAV